MVCSKEELVKLAGIQLRISEINAYVQQHQEPQQLIINPKQPLSRQPTNIASYSQPNSSKTPPSSGDIFTRSSFEQPAALSQQPTYNATAINNLRLSDTTNLAGSINNQLASTPTSVVTPLYSSTTGASVKLHPISEYGYKVSEYDFCFSFLFTDLSVVPEMLSPDHALGCSRLERAYRAFQIDFNPF